MRRFWTGWIIFVSVLGAGMFRSDGSVKPKKNIDYMGIHIIDQVRLRYRSIGGIAFGGISDLAWSTKKQELYMVSDRGSLFRFRMKLGRKIDLTPTGATLLKDANNTPYKTINERDTEGMTIDSKGRLLIAFEETPKIAVFGRWGRDFGRYLSEEKLPAVLTVSSNYVNGNTMLEAVTYHPKYGILTAAERPLKTPSDGLQRVYSLRGKVWAFPAEKHPNNGIVALAPMDDSNLLVLERAYISIFNPFIITLKKVYLNQCPHGICRSKVLAKMDMYVGWHVDNYEGLTQVGPNRYLMVTDDDYKFYRQTQLMYFEVR